MRQHHKAGGKLFVDYAVQTVPVVQQDTGEIQFAQIFVAVLGASNYTYAEATWSQRLPDWIGIHVRTFEFIKVVPVLLIPDNLKSSTTRACRYDPDINMSYQQMAAHYGTAIVPARPRKPQDKAKAEVGVQIIERWSLARLRHHTFSSMSISMACLKRLTTNHLSSLKAPGISTPWVLIHHPVFSADHKRFDPLLCSIIINL